MLVKTRVVAVVAQHQVAQIQRVDETSCLRICASAAPKWMMQIEIPSDNGFIARKFHREKGIGFIVSRRCRHAIIRVESDVSTANVKDYTADSNVAARRLVLEFDVVDFAYWKVGVV